MLAPGSPNNPFDAYDTQQALARQKAAAFSAGGPQGPGYADPGITQFNNQQQDAAMGPYGYNRQYVPALNALSLLGGKRQNQQPPEPLSTLPPLAGLQSAGR